MNSIVEMLENRGLKKEALTKLLPTVGKLAAVLFSSYILAAILGTVAAGWLSEATLNASKAKQQGDKRRAGLQFASPNYLKIQRSVIERNIFNSDGELPVEQEEGGGDTEAKPTVFDLNAPCNKASLNADLIGTIYLGDSPTSGSIATIQEKGYPQADVYKTGDVIVGTENAVIAKIEKTKVIINNGGTKECLELAPPKAIASSSSPGSSAPAGEGGEPPPPPPGGGGDVTLEASYVEQQVGEGGGNILNQGRLVPFNQDGSMKGFKLISLKPGGLFDKIGLKNGDVITQVNDTSLQQPDQGFAFYQAFENETEIRINFLRNGGPQSLNVKVK